MWVVLLVPFDESVDLFVGEVIEADYFASYEFGLDERALAQCSAHRVVEVCCDFEQNLTDVDRLAHFLLCLRWWYASISSSSRVLIFPPESHWSTSLLRKRSFLPSLWTGMRFWHTQS